MRTLGIDVGGSKLLALVVDERGTVISRVHLKTGEDTTPEALLSMIKGIHKTTVAEVGAIDAVGVGFPGLVESEKGRVKSTIMLKGWENVPLREMVSEVLSLPCAIENDVNTAALAELKLRKGDSRAMHSMVFVAVGTGIGGALAFGGKLWPGVGGFAGEIGNLVIDPGGHSWRGGPKGSVNSMAAGAAIEAELGFAKGGLKGLLETGDPNAIKAVMKGGFALGQGLAVVAGLINPALFVVGGGVALAGETYLKSVRLGLADRVFAQCAEGSRVEASIAGYDAGALGAALLAEGLVTGRRTPWN